VRYAKGEGHAEPLLESAGMDHEAHILAHFAASARLKQDAAPLLAPSIARAAEVVTASLFADGRVLACGNGGSAGDAQHFAAEMVGRFERERPELPAIALTTDSSILTAIAATTFAELPDVEMASSTSPLRPIARTCLAKTCSNA
jgi:SIS domain